MTRTAWGLLIRPLSLGLALAWLACGDPRAQPVAPEEGAGAPVAQDTLTFADAALEAAVREALSTPAGPLSQEALLGLTRLSARDRGIAALRGIERLAALAVLDLAGNRVRDLRPLAGLTGLTFLDVEYNRVADVAPLSGLAALEFLGLGYNLVTDISPLRGLRRLRSVALEGNPLNAASRTTQIAALEARGVQVSLGPSGTEGRWNESTPVAFYDFALEGAVRDAVGISFEEVPGDLTRGEVQSLPGLTAVGKGIADLRGLEALTGLLSLNVSGNEIVDVTPLTGLVRLTLLSMARNQIDDVAPLADLAALTFVNVDDNRIRDVAPLAGLTRLTSLYAERNQISDISPLVALPKLKVLALTGNPLNEVSREVHVPALRARGVRVDF